MEKYDSPMLHWENVYEVGTKYRNGGVSLSLQDTINYSKSPIPYAILLDIIITDEKQHFKVFVKVDPHLVKQDCASYQNKTFWIMLNLYLLTLYNTFFLKQLMSASCVDSTCQTDHPWAVFFVFHLVSFKSMNWVWFSGTVCRNVNIFEIGLNG